MRSPQRGGGSWKKGAINTNWNRLSKEGTAHLKIFQEGNKKKIGVVAINPKKSWWGKIFFVRNIKSSQVCGSLPAYSTVAFRL